METVKLGLVNKTRYQDDYVIQTIFRALDIIDETFLNEIIDNNYSNIIAFNTKEFMGLNFVKGKNDNKRN